MNEIGILKLKCMEYGARRDIRKTFKYWNCHLGGKGLTKTFNNNILHAGTGKG